MSKFIHFSLKILLIAFSSSVFSAPPAKDSLDEKARRTNLKQFSTQEFKNSKNHCQSFAKVAEHAASLTSKTGEWLEDMRLVIIGSDWSRGKDRGPYFHDVVTTDTGFKDYLRDQSSQVEHAMAAIYLGKHVPPGATVIIGGYKEAKDTYERNATLSTEDLILWGMGGDIGARVSDKNLSIIGRPIRITMCK